MFGFKVWSIISVSNSLTSYLVVLKNWEVSSLIVYQVGELYVKPNLKTSLTFAIAPNWIEKPSPLVIKLFSKIIDVIAESESKLFSVYLT